MANESSYLQSIEQSPAASFWRDGGLINAPAFDDMCREWAAENCQTYAQLAALAADIAAVYGNSRISRRDTALVANLVRGYITAVI